MDGGPPAGIGGNELASVTYYVVLPFVRDEDGNLCPEEAIECQSPHGATSKARKPVGWVSPCPDH